MKNNHINFISIIFFVLFLGACGGGGGGSSPNGGGSGNPPPPPPPPPPAQRPTALVPEYTGATSDYIINNANIGETVVSTLSVLDFLNQIVFDTDFQNSLFIEQTRSIPYTSENLACESGSSSTTENAATTELRIAYTNCVVEGDRLNGTTQGFVDNSSGSDRATINIDLSIETLADSSTINLLGNIVVTPQGNIIYNLLLSDDDETIWFDNIIAFVDEVNLSLYFQGDIYIASSGKLNIATNTIVFDFDQNATVFDLDITGDQVLSVNIVQGQTLSIAAASLGSPLLLDLTDFAGLPEQNLPPIARAESQGTAFYDAFIAIDGALSSDPNLQVITLDWQVVSQVEGAEVIIETDGALANVSANRPGEYTIRLIASDPLGESDQTDVVLSFSKRPPQASLSFDANSFNYGSLATATTVISSPEFDGPFSLSLEYAPEGMQIDEDGRLSWQVNLPNLGQPIVVNAGVRVTSPEFSTLISGQMLATPVQSLKRIPINTTLSRNYKFALDTQEPVLLTNGSAFNVSFEGEELILQAHPLPNSIAQFAYAILHIADIDQDGDLDYFVTEQDQVTLAHRLWSIDAAGNRTLFSEFSFEFDEPFDLDVLILDLIDSPGKELVLINREFGDFFQVLSNEGELLGTQGPLQSPWCDIDDDGKADWLADFGYRLFNDTEITPLMLDPFLVVTQPAFRGLSNDCTLLSYRMNDQGLPFEIVVLDPFADVDTDAESVIANIPDLATQFNISNYVSVSLTELNIDNDDADELIVTFFANDGTQQLLLIDDVASDTQSARRLSLDQAQSTFNGLGFFATQILDINNDGADEIITFRNDQFQSTGKIQASFLSGSTVSQFSHSPTLSSGLGLIDYWDGSRGVINTGTNSLIDLSLSGDVASQREIEELSFTSLIAQELGQRFSYTVIINPNNSALELSKQSLDGTSVYSTPFTEPDSPAFSYAVGEINDDYLLLIGFQAIIVRRDTGEAIYRFPEGTIPIVMNNRKYIVPGETETEGFVLAYDSNTLYAAELMPDGSFASYDFAALENLLQNNFSRASLIQVNDTPALDFVMHFGFFGEEDVVTIDFSNKVITELPQSIFNNINEPEPNLGLLSRCIENSQTCQNSIYGKNNTSFNGYDTIYAVDAITGNTVWRTQQDFVGLKNIAIAKDTDTFKSLMITDEDWFVLE